MDEGPNQALLIGLLEVAVPEWQARLRQHSWDYLDHRRHDLATTIASRGDVVMYAGKRTGASAEAFNALAETLALLSFGPRGVTFCGRHWEARHPEISGRIGIAEVGWIVDGETR